jgi:hypothetical protein
MLGGLNAVHLSWVTHGTTKPTLQDFVPLLSREEKGLMGITPFTS